MKRIFIILFVIFLLVPCFGYAGCEDLLFRGGFTTTLDNGILDLFLNRDGTFSIHISSEKVLTDKSFQSDFSGNWRCDSDVVILSFNGKKIRGKHETIGKNPNGIPENVKVLKFETLSGNILSGKILTEFEL